MRRVKRASARGRSSRDNSSRADEEWRFADPEAVERALIRVSECVQRADGALTEALPATRRWKERGSFAVVKRDVDYLERLLRDAVKHIEKADKLLRGQRS